MSMKNTCGEVRETALPKIEAKEVKEIGFNRLVSLLRHLQKDVKMGFYANEVEMSLKNSMNVKES